MPRAGVRSGGWVFVLIISDLAMQLVRKNLSPLLAAGPPGQRQDFYGFGIP